MTEQTSQADQNVASRRAILKFGAIGAATIVTVQPSIAQAAVSVMNCQIPVPHSGAAGQWVAADGSLVPAYTPGAFGGTARPYTAEEVKIGLSSGSLPYTPSDASSAYLNYIRKLQAGQTGFTCFASIQMPR